MKPDKNTYLLIFLSLLILYLSPNLLFLESTQYLRHDNLDSNVVWYKNLVESGNMFGPSDSVIPQSLGGLPRNFAPTEWNLMHWLYMIFPAFYAYNINAILMHFLAFLGMFLLGRDYLFRKSDAKWLVPLFALGFALVPFWPSGGLTSAGQPLLLWALLNIFFYEKAWYNWLVIAAFPFYSSLILGNLFFVFLISFFFLGYSIYAKELRWPFVLALFVFTTVSIFVEYRLFILTIFDQIPTQRDTYKLLGGTLNMKGVVWTSALLFFKGHYHFFGRVFPILPLVALVGFWAANKHERYGLGVLLMTGAFCAFLSMIRDQFYISEVLAFLFKINPRFYSLLTPIWFLIFGISLMAIIRKKAWGKYFVSSALGLMVLAHFFNLFGSDFFGSRYLENSFYFTYIDNDHELMTTFDELYNPDLFEKAKEEIGIPDHRVACFGYIPEVAQYNGYKTIGGYYVLYPMAHCENINDVKNTPGARCGGRLVFNYEDLDNPGFSFVKLKALNTYTVFSDQSIDHPELSLKKTVSNANSTLYIYDIL